TTAMPTACGAILALHRFARVRPLTSRRESLSIEYGQRPATVFADEDRQQLGGFGGARILREEMRRARRLEPCLSLAERAGSPALQLRAQRALDHEGRDRAGMSMPRRVGIRRKPDERRGDRMPGNIRQFFAGRLLDDG